MKPQEESSGKPLHFRLRNDKKIVGYQKNVGQISFFSLDGRKWSAEPIEAGIKDVHVGLLDKRRNKIFCWDILLIRPGVFDETETKGVFVPIADGEPLLVLLHNGEKIETPTLFLGWNDWQVIGQAFAFPSLLRKLRQNNEIVVDQVSSFSDCLLIFGWQTGMVFGCICWDLFRFGQFGPLFPAFGLAVGSFLGLIRLRSRHGPILTRSWILSLAVGGGKLFAVFVLSLLIVIPFVRFDIFVVPLQSKLWMFPFLSFMAGFGALACIMLSGEILSTMHGGYDDER